jgi:hypothetical protein
MFWSIVGAVLAVVLLGAWLYDRRHKVSIRTRGSELEGAAAQARARVDLNHLYDPNRGPGGITPGN